MKKQNGTMKDFLNNTTQGKDFIFELTQRNPEPSVTSANGTPMYYPPSVHVPLRSEVYDPKLGMNRIVNYAPGERFLFLDEQSEITKNSNKEFMAEFKSGYYIAHGENTMLLKALMMSAYNESNADRDKSKPALFKFVDTSSNYNNIVKEGARYAEALTWVFTADFDAVKAYARVLLGDNMGNDAAEVRYNMERIAAQDPDKFLTDLKSPTTMRKHYVLEAIERRVLHVNYGQNSISWYNNQGSPLSTAPIGVDPIDHFVKATFTPDGEKVFSEIQSMASPQITHQPSNNTVPVNIPEVPQGLPDKIEHTGVSDSEATEMLNALIERGTIEKAGAWYLYKSQKWQGFGKFKDALAGDALLLREIRKEFNK